MAFHLQSTENTALYFNGSVLQERGYLLSMFSSITNARSFDTEEEAIDISEVIKVPVNVVEA